MNIHRYLPSERLKPYIQSYLVIESLEAVQNKILPEGALVMAFSIRGKITFYDTDKELSLPEIAITGIRKQSRLINYAKNSATLLVKFTTTGASAFFKNPLNELANKTSSVTDIFSKVEIDFIQEKLCEASCFDEAIQNLETWLCSLIKNEKIDYLVQEAARLIKQSKGQIRIGEIYTTLNTSKDPLEKRFRKVTGTSPKQFADLLRLRSIVSDYSKTNSLTELAYLNGFYDQAHFSKYFKYTTGNTPRDFFKNPRYW
ncbi:MAG: AraC family transcriptional regulator [Thalassobius sp.]|nr:AraC family transcriptional regulator [Thalassovita sp.]